MLARFTGRSGVISVLAIAPIAGAAVGAGLHPLPDHRFTAEARVVLAPAGSGSSTASDDPRLTKHRMELVARLVTLDPVLVRVARRANTPGPADSIRARVTAVFSPELGSLTLRARDRTPALAVALTNALTNQAADVTRQLQIAGGRGDLVIGDFESGLGDWAGTSQFSAKPDRVDLASNNARYGQRWMRVRCGRTPGCGPSAALDYPFRAGVEYVASGWVRSYEPSRVALLFGSSSRDVQISQSRTLSSRWRRMTLRWVPRTDASHAEVAFLKSGDRGAVFGVDAVLISDSRASPAGIRGGPSGVEEAQSIRAARGVTTVIPAESTGVMSSRTLPWALGGGGAGLCVALAAIAGYRAAGRRPRSALRRSDADGSSASTR